MSGAPRKSASSGKMRICFPHTKRSAAPPRSRLTPAPALNHGRSPCRKRVVAGMYVEKGPIHFFCSKTVRDETRVLKINLFPSSASGRGLSGMPVRFGINP